MAKTLFTWETGFSNGKTAWSWAKSGHGKEMLAMEITLFRLSRKAYSVGRGLIWPTFEYVQAFIQVLITGKYEKDRIINSRERLDTSFSHIVESFKRSLAANRVVSCQIWPKFERIKV